MKCCFGHLALGEAVPCRLRYEDKAYECNTGTRLVACTGTELRKENDKPSKHFLDFSEMKGQFFIGDCSPAVRYSPHTSGLPLPSGL
ncbi:hypothetical protein ACTJKN_21450 [Pedobacter sp. 22163]|uniref:hypothetical protein n=1 Tax=Pedobacter sp. 22163 TaxID=3453883 RepID=UPI003F832BD9